VTATRTSAFRQLRFALQWRMWADCVEKVGVATGLKS
jgi:hypothetical protein